MDEITLFNITETLFKLGLISYIGDEEPASYKITAIGNKSWVTWLNKDRETIQVQEFTEEELQALTP